VAWRPTRIRDDATAARDQLTAEPNPLVTRDLARVMDGIIADQAGVSSDIRSLPGVAGSVRLLAGHISGMRLQSGSAPLPMWLARPRTYGAGLDIADLLQYLVDSMLIHGKGYVKAWCAADGDAPSFRLDALDPNYVQVQNRADGVVGRSFMVAGEPMPEVPPRLSDCVKGAAYLLHIPYRVSVEHPEGTTPLSDAAMTLRGHLSTEKHAAFTFDSGTYIGGVLSTEQDITEDQAIEAGRVWTEARQQGRVAVLGNGISYRNETVPNKDLQMLETRAYAASTVYALLGIPQSIMGSTLIGGATSLSYSNSQDNERLYARNALRPIGEQITSGFSTLLPHGRNAAEDHRLEFDYSTWEGTADDSANGGNDPAPGDGNSGV
jgi:hypothetical protein